MPNKDSFTFSDKLKKSKSLPLSKRIPSKVGGDGKAKRTLIQRAQRDLPFIIVAAAALLLLPFLSRNSGTEEAGTEPSMDFVNSDTGNGEGATSPELGQEIAPSSGFKNPLDLIIPRGGKDSDGTRDNVEPGDESASSGENEISTPTYEPKEGGSEESATGTFGSTAKNAVRHAVERHTTQVNSLKNSETAAMHGSTGVSRTLVSEGSSGANGKRGGGINPGIRPVALQAMSSAGKGGRSETGEGLYAEAARSIGAMNGGSAKQALFDAQLKNVDGTPLGSAGIGGSPSYGAGGRVGAGGAPSNSVSYKPYLPWWWDFEKQKAMKHWELWNYNFQKAASDSIIKVGTAMALCLATGNGDGKIDKFFGDSGGSDDYTCVGAEDTVLNWSDHRDLGSKVESGSGDNAESRSTATFADWAQMCKDAGGTVKVKPAGKKNMLDVRLRCLGLKYKNLIKKTEYDEASDCEGVNEQPVMNFKVTGSRDRKYAVYVLAAANDGKDAAAYVVYLKEGDTLDGAAANKILKTKNMHATEVGALVLDRNYVLFKSKLNLKYLITFKNLESRVNKGEQVTASEFHKIYPLGLKLAKSCTVSHAFDQTTISGVELAEGDASSFNDIQPKGSNGSYVLGSPFEDCTSLNPKVRDLNALADHTFTAVIQNPGKHVYIAVAEWVPYADQEADKGKNKDGKFVVKYVRDLALPENHMYVKDIGNGAFLYSYTFPVGKSAKSSGQQGANAAPGTGRVFWVTTNGDAVKAKEGQAFDSDQIKASDLVKTIGGKRQAYCEYKWGCNAKSCSSKNVTAKDYCWKENNGTVGIYEASLNGASYVASGSDPAATVNGSIKKADYASYFGAAAWYKNLTGDMLMISDIKKNVPQCYEKKETPSAKPIMSSPECNFKADVNFEIYSYDVLNFTASDAGVQAFYNKCLSKLASEKNITVYVTGFTSEDGDLAFCKKMTSCQVVDSKGQEYRTKLPNGNLLLSEDRALSTTEKLVENIKQINASAANPLPLSYNLDFTRQAKSDPQWHFTQHNPMDESAISGIASGIASDSNTSDAKINVTFVVRGYGSYKHTRRGDYANDRQVIVGLQQTNKRIK